MIFGYCQPQNVRCGRSQLLQRIAAQCSRIQPSTAEYSRIQRRTCPDQAPQHRGASGAPDGLHRVSACRVRLQHLRRRWSVSQTVKPAHWVRYWAASAWQTVRHCRPSQRSEMQPASGPRCRPDRMQARAPTLGRRSGSQRGDSRQQAAALGGQGPAPSQREGRGATVRCSHLLSSPAAFLLLPACGIVAGAARNSRGIVAATRRDSRNSRS